MTGNQSTRRRCRAPAYTQPAFVSSSFHDRTYGPNSRPNPVTNDIHNDNGNHRNRRKRFKRPPRTFGELRRLDWVFIIAAGIKLASILHFRPRRIIRSDPSSSSTQKSFPTSESFVESDTSKVSFIAPILFRRGNADESHNHKQNITPYRGLFRSRYLSDSIKELSRIGFAVVDDVIYHADEQLDLTHWALETSKSEPLLKYHDDELLNNLHRTGIVNDSAEEHAHYIDDGGDWDAYYAFDDDYIRSAKGTGLHEKRPTDESVDELCIRPSFYRMYYPTCNDIHAYASGTHWLIGENTHKIQSELKVSTPEEPQIISKYLGSGYYRDSFLLKRFFVSSPGRIHFDELVFKSMKTLNDKSLSGIAEDDEVVSEGWGYDPSDHYYYSDLLEDMRKDAMVMELLTSSPRAANIYSHCAMSSITEFAPTDIEKYILPSSGFSPKKLRSRFDNHSVDTPINNYISPSEKLKIALEMAKCIAAMHGFVNGPIAHVDVQMSQFFRGRDGYIKLVDFNRAEVLLFDVKQNNYCKFVNGPPADASLRSPEEAIDAPLNEKIDIFSLGNVFYALLTGLIVYLGESRIDTHKHIVEGDNEPIADYFYESPGLAALAEAIEMCWTYDVEDRPTIFEIVRFLERAVEENKEYQY